MIQYLGFVDSLKVCANARDDCTAWRIHLKDPIFSFLCPGDLHVLIGPSGGSSLLGSVKIFIRHYSRDSHSKSYLGLSLVDIEEQYKHWCTNITAHNACSVLVIKYFQRVLRVLLGVIMIS